MIWHYKDFIMSTIVYPITSLAIVYTTVNQAQIKEHIKALCHWPMCGEFTGDRWSPSTKGQSRKCFHLMTSSWVTDQIWQSVLSFARSHTCICEGWNTHIAQKCPLIQIHNVDFYSAVQTYAHGLHLVILWSDTAQFYSYLSWELLWH